MTIFTDFEDVHWEAATAAGMHVACTFLLPGSGVPQTVYVYWEEPDQEVLAHGRSKQYEIHYRTKDMPDLKEGDVLSIAERVGCTTDYRVREDPYVSYDRGSDGTYRCALLTREEPRG